MHTFSGWMRHKFGWTIGVLVAALAVSGCGSAGNDPKPATTRSETAKPSKPKPRKTYRQQVADCVGDVAFETRDAGNALRVESPGGRLIANIQTFNSKREAEDFAGQLEVDGAQGGKGVAVWLRDADDSSRAVVTDCLTP